MENWIENFAVGLIILIYGLGIIYIVGVGGFLLGVLFGRYPIIIVSLILWAGFAIISERFLSK